MCALVHMDISYDGQFTEEVLLSVLPFLPLRCDDYDQETVLCKLSVWWAFCVCLRIG